MQSRLTPPSKTLVLSGTAKRPCPTHGLIGAGAVHPAAPVSKAHCEYGNYPWDRWEEWAIAQGLDPDLAGLARLTIREAYQHGWDEQLKGLCGWRDDGQGMLELALRSPGKARCQWNILLRTDGLRGDYRPRSTEWTWGYLRPDAQRFLRDLQTR